MADKKYKVEKHVFREGTEEFNELNSRGLLCRNLRNVVTWLIRQHFFCFTGQNYTCDVFSDCEYKYLSYRQIYDHLFHTTNPDYDILPATVAQAVIRSTVAEWTAYKKLMEKKRAGEYDGYVGLPNYSKENVPYVAEYMRSNLSEKSLKENIVNIPKTKISVRTAHADTLHTVKVCYVAGMYYVNIIYEDRDEYMEYVDNGRVLCADMGVDNFATFVANVPGFRPFIMDGRELKSINNYFNKKISNYTEKMCETNPDFESDEYTRKLWADRRREMDDIMHLMSRRTLEIALHHDIRTIVIGHNDRWKDNINLGKNTNQKFAYIPFDKYFRMLKYKAEKYGILVVKQEESYTSKASFYDDDEIPVYDKNNHVVYKFSGKRIKRGLYVSKNKLRINADVNGALNIMRKYLNVSSKEIVECIGVVMAPTRVRISDLRIKKSLLKKFNGFKYF